MSPRARKPKSPVLPPVPQRVGAVDKAAGKLSKKDPDYYAKIGRISAEKRKAKGTQFYSEMAAKSHPRAEYHGGRPKKIRDQGNRDSAPKPPIP